MIIDSGADLLVGVVFLYFCYSCEKLAGCAVLISRADIAGAVTRVFNRER